MKKRTVFVWLLLAVLTLSGCGGEPEETASVLAGRMVERIEVTLSPEAEDYRRVYVTQENMTALLGILRAMTTDEVPEEEPNLEGGQSYYTAAVTHANGAVSEYILLGRTWLRQGEEPWRMADGGQAQRFADFLQSHPSDDGSEAPETTAPPETTVPPTTA